MPGTEPQPDAEGIERYGYTQELHRSLSFTDLLVYGLIFMVPIAPFGIFGSVFQGSGGMVALAYAVGMLAMMFTAASYARPVPMVILSASKPLPRPSRTPQSARWRAPMTATFHAPPKLLSRPQRQAQRSRPRSHW